MSDDSGGSGGTRMPGNLDRRRIRRYTRALNNKGARALNQKRSERIQRIIKNSEAQGTWNKKDEKALGRLYKAINRVQKEEKKKQPPRTGANAQSSGATHKQSHGHSKPKGRSAPGGRNRGGRGTGTSVSGMTYNPGQFTPPSRREARLAVDQENNRLIRSLLDEAGARRNDARYGVNQANALFDRSKGDLDYIFGEAKDYIGNRNQAIAQGYQNTGNELGNIYEQLQGALQQGSGTNRSRAAAELQRLGIQGAGMGQFDADANNMQMLAQQQGANSQALNEMGGNASAEIGNLLSSMSQASLASAVGRATNTRNDDISGIRQDYRRELSEIRDNVRDVHRNRPATINELYQAMRGNAFQEWAETGQMNFNNQLAANEFNLGVSKMNSDNFWKKQSHLRDLAESRKRRRLAQQEEAARRVSNDLAGKFNAFDMLGW